MPDPQPAPAELVALMPFSRELGITLEAADPSHVVGTDAWTAQRCTAGGVLHGGVLMGLADSVGAICAVLNLPEGATTSTIESKTNFFRAVRAGTVPRQCAPASRGAPDHRRGDGAARRRRAPRGPGHPDPGGAQWRPP